MSMDPSVSLPDQTDGQGRFSSLVQNVRCLYEPVGVKVVLSRSAFLALHVLGPYCRGQVRR